jgi:hypothetical protein
MKSIRRVAFLFAFWHVSAFAAVDCKTIDERLSDLVSTDQQIRQDWVALSKKPNAETIEKDALQQRWRVIDAANLSKLKEIVADCGWPSGKAGSHSAWLLAQHADSDIAFQRHAVDLLEGAVKNGVAAPRDLAYLADRIAIAEGRPQLYGTQFTQPDRCHLKMLPVDSVELVNRRRLAIGLQSLEDYEAEGRKRFIAADCQSEGG